MEKGKISQVPFLIDTDNKKMMYESDKIIEYIAQLNNK
jgi:glutathione S-transferase